MLEAQPLKTRLNLNDEEFISNKKSMLGKLDEIDELLDEAEAGGGRGIMKDLLLEESFL